MSNQRQVENHLFSAFIHFVPTIHNFGERFSQLKKHKSSKGTYWTHHEKSNQMIINQPHMHYMLSWMAVWWMMRASWGDVENQRGGGGGGRGKRMSLFDECSLIVFALFSLYFSVVLYYNVRSVHLQDVVQCWHDVAFIIYELIVILLELFILLRLFFLLFCFFVFLARCPLLYTSCYGWVELLEKGDKKRDGTMYSEAWQSGVLRFSYTPVNFVPHRVFSSSCSFFTEPSREQT